MSSDRHPSPTFEVEITVSAAHCNPQQELTMPRLVQEIIDIATAHADSWNVGYERLIADNTAWVLSRLSLRLNSPLKVKQTYRLTTWVESLNRHFTKRMIAITDSTGAPVGIAATIWAAIDIATRRSVNLQQWADDMAIGLWCPPFNADLEPPRLQPLTEVDRSTDYRVEYADLDFNCHVTTTRYIQLILNQWQADRYNEMYVSGLDVAFMAETRAGSTLSISCSTPVTLNEHAAMTEATELELSREGTAAIRASIAMTRRPAPSD